MTTRLKWVGLAMGVLVGCAVPIAAWSQAGQVAARDLGPLADPDEFTRRGDATIASLCAMECHDENQVFTVRRTAREWSLVITDMARRGAKGSAEDRDLVRRYLTWSFGVVAVNSATAEELAAVIGLPGPVAEAIVSHRQKQGRFADLQGLLGVPGVDKATIDAQVDALRFE
jgi:competence ComEA-like helix-hairpin-helix protein